MVVVRAPRQVGSAAAETARQGASNDIIRIDLSKLLEGVLPPNLPIYAGDTLYVPAIGYIFVSGEVLRPGRYRLERQMTVFKAITLAGGFSRFAAKNRVTVQRLTAGQPREYSAQMEDLLQAEDTLIVPKSIF
jgi:polysaccharide export outer membrane protein